MDYVNLSADFDIWSSNFTQGRGGYALKYVVLHHNAGIRMSHQGVHGAFVSNGTSAHYNVDADGSVCQYVHDSDTAYHAGNWAANCQSIGIEHANIGGASTGWAISDETVESGAHLTAAICAAYGLGRPEWRGNVFPHSDFFSTACPAALRDELADQYMSRAQYWYDHLGEEEGPGWVKEGNGWWYRKDDGSWETGWFQVGDQWFLADEKGWLKSGWVIEDGAWYYLHPTHDTRFGVMETGWVQDGENWFYLGDDGKMCTGWVQVKGKWYFLESNGVMRTGWLADGGHHYFLDESGAMVTGVARTRLDGGCSAFDDQGHLVVGRVVLEQDAQGVLRAVKEVA